MLDFFATVRAAVKSYFNKFISLWTTPSPSALAVPSAWSFVDSIKAANTGHYHIRQLTNKGRQAKGTAIDTPILCGVDNRRDIFFDVPIPFTEGNIILGCQRCVAVYRAAELDYGPNQV